MCNKIVKMGRDHDLDLDFGARLIHEDDDLVCGLRSNTEMGLNATRNELRRTKKKRPRKPL